MRARGLTCAILSSRPRQTWRGARADLLFKAVMVRVLEEIHKGSGEMSGGVMVPFAAGQNIRDLL